MTDKKQSKSTNKLAKTSKSVKSGKTEREQIVPDKKKASSKAVRKARNTITDDSSAFSLPGRPQMLTDTVADSVGDELIQLDRQLLELLNRKIHLEKIVLERSKSSSGLLSSQSLDSGFSSGDQLGSGDRYSNWSIDHQRIETLALANEGDATAASPGCVRAVFREILSEVRRQSHPTRLAFLGPQYSFTHLAALRYFGTSAEMIPVSTIAGIFEEVHNRSVDFGIVPIENSTDGAIVDTLEMFTQLPIKISGEIRTPIHHNLLGNLPRSEIRQVYSKPQAISQCRSWLAKHLNSVRLIEITSTTAAVEMAKKTPQTAAIASIEAANFYEMDVLAENIEDNPNNMTRFVVLGRDYYPRTGTDKTSVMFELSHQVGTLAESMAIFKRNRLNLTWIESFPIHEQTGLYRFFIELEGHIRDLRVRRALVALQKKAVKLDVLGSYARYEVM